MGEGEHRGVVQLVRASDHFLGRREWEEFDRRLEAAMKGKTKTKRPCRMMAVCWWVISTGVPYKRLFKAPPVIASHPRLRLLPRAWVWLDRWLVRRRKLGLHLIHDAPLFCTEAMAPPLMWPGGLRGTIITDELKTYFAKTGCGQAHQSMIPKLASSYRGDRRMTRREFEEVQGR